MNIILNNGFYMATDSRAGPWSVVGNTPTTEQENNANIIRSFFINEGWTIEAICGMIGCMQGESTINPAFIQDTNRYRLPNSAADLTDVPNSVMKHFFKEYYAVTNKAFGVGLVQWDGYSEVTIGGVTEQQQKLVAYGIRNNIIWYDGWTQLYRIRGEQAWDVSHGSTSFFQPVRYSGVTYTFANYPYSTATPETLAEAWTSGYERNAGGVGFRGQNARYWYDWFTGPNAPALIDPQYFLLPLPADPLEPPFDPDNPADPDLPGFDYMPAWLTCIFRLKRKVMKHICRTA